ncbi:high mobility group B protein 3-like [Odontomachus brunneus]|uniref:high mobility group B protein 3-like n=1 Tax=Odontomachus brunneus TaxID=486640 RepID=UPI0013F182A1|nr:high mobility group B protein 3-like [Odontomachus brunneus]
MENSDKREEKYEVTEDARGQERDFDDKYQMTSRSSSDRKSKQIERNDRRRASRSRSRSKPPQRKQRRSANAFLNFIQDFKQDHNKLKSQDLFRLGGQRWRRMSSTEKMPYVEAANLAKQQTQQNGKNERQNKPVGGDSSKKPDNQKDQKKKDQERKRSKSRTDDSDIDSDSMTPETDATMTSEDISDLSS